MRTSPSLTARFGRIAFAAMLTLAGLARGGEAAPTVAPSAEDRALAARAEAAVAKAEGTPGQEQINFLFHEWPSGFVRMLKGEQPATADQLNQGRAIVQEHLPIIEKGPDWPRPPVVRIPRAAGPMTIDGRLDAQEWSRSVSFDGLYPLNEKERRETPSMRWRAAWDADRLYFSFECGDADLVAPVLERDGPVFSDDSVEVFLLPEWNPAQYWELVLSPSGCIFDALHTKKLKGWGPEPGGPAKNMEGLQFAREVRGTLNQPGDRDEGYTMEVAVPFRVLPSFGQDKPPAPGVRLLLMLCRMDKSAGKFQAYYFVPVLSWSHNVWNYAEAVLEE